MMAVISISHDDVIDVEFETVVNQDKLRSRALPKAEQRPVQPTSPDQLAMLRDQFSDPATTSQPDALSPTFLIVTLICAFVVFWVSGGHTLLY
ncbi:MAG: hypothetical protein ACRCU5_11100 [Rhizobiaceae bacterium]